MTNGDANVREPDADSASASEEAAAHVRTQPGARVREVAGIEGGAALHSGGACGSRQGSAQRVAPLGTRGVGAGAGTCRPGRAPRAAGPDTSARAFPDPLWADAGVPVRLLQGRCLPDGGRPRGRPSHGAARPALRRCASLQLRHLRRTGSEARLQHQRLRRDASRAVRVGRQAARRELRGRGPGARLRRCDPPLGRDGDGARIPPGDGALCRDAESFASGTRVSMSPGSRTSSGRASPESR